MNCSGAGGVRMITSEKGEERGSGGLRDKRQNIIRIFSPAKLAETGSID
jgi:hypothetical protein